MSNDQSTNTARNYADQAETHASVAATHAAAAWLAYATEPVDADRDGTRAAAVAASDAAAKAANAAELSNDGFGRDNEAVASSYCESAAHYRGLAEHAAGPDFDPMA